ncbi:Osmotically-inducible protein OsmY, contains BON domain [Propionivibrio dicarboxylicus]|uniref:Osmotically-inducible protein OsmY, contains BON domain n=2 Tax=Propionivibrio dicarboxylicus TaxID=83767 RepID=A0A1G8FGG1_9RHOO|nr:Osmotically-inducible protein OsmY, contains BON domain [Propionivibrio dicarboxylicus]
MNKRLIAALLLGATLLPTLQGCLPLVATGATVGVLAAVDRRSVGTQTEDESIEWKASARIRDNLGDRAHVNVTSYNRKVLLTGETFTEEAKAEVDRLVRDVPNVHGTYNELVVAPSSSFTARSNDAFITSKIKSRSVDNGKFNPVHVKVVTEAGVAFLLGTVTQAEADAALHVAATTAGVKKVVNLLEIISVARAREIDAAPANAKPGNEPR